MAHDADLANTQAGQPGQVEQLDVKSETVKRQVWRQRRHRLCAEHFVAALRIADAGHGEQSYDRIERAAAHATAPRFTGALRAGRFTRADDDLRGIGVS